MSQAEYAYMPTPIAPISLQGKIALITGASKGLGRSMALALGQAGATIALVSRDEAKLSGVKSEVEALGAKAEVFVADVRNEAQVLRKKSPRDAVPCKSLSTTPASTCART
jgi:short-subunit dehydrogenase